MLRVLLIGAFFILEPLASFGQEAPRGVDVSLAVERARLMQAVRVERLDPMPAEMNPVVAGVRGIMPGDDADLGFAGDSLTDEQILRRMARLYRYQSDLLDAQARGDADAVEELLDVSMHALAVLVDQPGLMEQPRFRELYRSIVVEYEQYYGFTDSLVVEQGDIFPARARAFAAIEAMDRAPLEGIHLPELATAETVFPMTINERVRSSIVFLLTDPDKHINHWLGRAETYFPMIEKIFEEEGLPDELKYLAMIESGLNPRARSWARAVGMWQFVRATARAYDLNTNGWIDERMNPEKSTRAAARHLNDLYKMFGDWQLALAGYNYSPGKLRRHLRRAEAQLGRKATYWDVYGRLPRETRNYVPMFIATAIVASNPKAFGLGKDVVPGPAYEFDYVPVQGMLALEDIASMAGTDIETIRALNPELRGAYLPPTRSAYYVRLPIYSYDRFAEAYRRLPASEKQAATHHRVRRGETLGQIARRYGVSVSSLMRKNGLHSSLIRVGKTLVVPVTSYTGGIQIADARPLRVQYGMRLTRPIVPASTETLDSSLLIARAEQQREENLRIVQVREAVESEADDTNSEAKPAAETAPAETRIVYRVRRGDTLIKIARKFRVTVEDLRRWNDISSSMIRIGQRLTIYSKSS